MIRLSITGDLGSGKSTIAKKLCKILNSEYYSTGKIQRELGQKKGMNTLEMNYYSETNDEIDEIIDKKLIELNRSKKNIIFDSRMAWYFIYNSFKIYLTTHPMIAALRVLDDKTRNTEPTTDSINEMANKLIERQLVENRRFNIKYNVDCSDYNNYDLIIDTSIATIDEITNKIINVFELWKTKKTFNKMWVSPLSLIPMENIRILTRDEAKIVNNSIASSGFDNDYEVKVVKSNGFYYIWDGHKRTSGAIFNKVNLIPIEIIAENNEELQTGLTVSDFVTSSLNLSFIYDWEDVHNFHFEIYPGLTNL